MNPTMMLPVHGIPVAKRLCKNDLELKQISNFLGPRSGIKLGHLRYYQQQPLDAQIYPNKFLQSHVEEKIQYVAVEAYEYVDDICAVNVI